VKISPELLIYKFDYHVPDVLTQASSKNFDQDRTYIYIYSFSGKAKSTVQLHFSRKA